MCCSCEVSACGRAFAAPPTTLPVSKQTPVLVRAPAMMLQLLLTVSQRSVQRLLPRLLLRCRRWHATRRELRATCFYRKQTPSAHCLHCQSHRLQSLAVVPPVLSSGGAGCQTPMPKTAFSSSTARQKKTDASAQAEPQAKKHLESQAWQES
jgi:hypothetical protein